MLLFFIMHKSHFKYAFYILDIFLTKCYDLSVGRVTLQDILNGGHKND